jgi:hypothetical protein
MGVTLMRLPGVGRREDSSLFSAVFTHPVYLEFIPNKSISEMRRFSIEILYCHDEIAIAGIDFIGKRPIYGHFLEGEGCSWATATRIDSLGHRSCHRWSRRGNQGLEVMNMHLILYPTMQLSIFFHRFRYMFWTSFRMLDLA